MIPAKKIATYFLMAVVLIHTLNTSLLYVNFKINRDYIASTLCENKTKPITICGGKCYLAKQIKEAHEEQQSGEAPVKTQQVEVLYFADLFSFHYSYEDDEQNKFVITNKDISSNHFADIFHPPIV